MHLLYKQIKYKRKKYQAIKIHLLIKKRKPGKSYIIQHFMSSINNNIVC